MHKHYYYGFFMVHVTDSNYLPQKASVVFCELTEPSILALLIHVLYVYAWSL